MNLSLEDYITEIEIQNYSKATVKNKKAILLQFERWLWESFQVELEDASTRHIKRYIKYLLDKEIKANTINTKLKTLNNFYKFCIKEKILKDNPLEDIELLKEEKVMIKPFSIDDIQKMIDFYCGSNFMDVRNKTVLTCLFETGIRSAELSGIKLEDVFDDAILIRGKGNKQRLVPVSLHLKRQIIKYRRAREKYLKGEECPYLFVCTRTKGGGLKKDIESIGRMGHEAVLNVVKRSGKACGVDVKLLVHSCRRSYAQISLGHTDLYTVSRLLGHNHVATTERYIQSMEDKTVLERGRNASPLSTLRKKYS
ncbi:tyrosine-type recombinase/integrase [Neobacillus kokaensis]|uniref:Tyrosine recombinase XerC n=1 Tax=Neobacillus kokaensis TaxID=2759023 RepID=A0ABQ3MXN4_9BACI|nr:tyrosine-type recombinase/integrase [Neobacillus kokaensis]GHH96604.1 tyrosine recombinase XerC [Neobacillus kokaensis]